MGQARELNQDGILYLDGLIERPFVRENTLDRVSLTPGSNPGPRDSVVGDPVINLMIGPTAAAWSRNPSEHGHVAYVTTDGGIKSPMPDGLRPAKVLRVTL